MAAVLNSRCHHVNVQVVGRVETGHIKKSCCTIAELRGAGYSVESPSGRLALSVVFSYILIYFTSSPPCETNPHQ